MRSPPTGVLKPILDDIAETMASETVEQDLAGDPGEWIEEAYEQDRSIYWRKAISEKLTEMIKQEDEQRRPRVIELLREKLDGAG